MLAIYNNKPSGSKPLQATILALGIVFGFFAQALASQENITEELSANKAPKTAGKIVIIMDDIGNNISLGRRAVELPGAITYAILPHTPAAKKLAFYTTQLGQGKEVIVHMPMEADHHQHLGHGGLLAKHSQQQFIHNLKTALNEVPFAKGLSNHMGSRLTALPDRMHWLMDELSKQGLYFVDSKTTGNSAAKNAAQDSHIPYLSRDIFLDHDPSPAAIHQAFEKAKITAQKSGLAIVLAHPYRQTLDFLERALPDLKRSNFQLINTSEALTLIHSKQKLAMQ